MHFHILSVGTLTTLGAFLSLSATNWAAPAGPVFYGDAPDEHHPWAIHDRNRPKPKIVTPGAFSSQEQPGKAPSDAIILFDGTDASKWESSKDGSPIKWQIDNGALVSTTTGDIQTKEQFADCQLHVEWSAPKEVKGSDQGRGNSGIFLMGQMEIQVLDCYNNETYADGYAGAVYGINPPMANALRAPGEWQVYDIVFRRPVYDGNKVLDPGYVTVFVNGVLVQDHTPLEGSGGHMGRTKAGPFPAKGPLRLQDHGNPTRFRNIWYRQLPIRSVEGGTDGYLTTEATMAKRKEIAAGIREGAAKLTDPANPLPEMFQLMESLVYFKDDATFQKAQSLAQAYVDGLKKLSAEDLAKRKDEALHVRNVFNYLAKFKIIPDTFAPRTAVAEIVKAQGWDKKR